MECLAILLTFDNISEDHTTFHFIVRTHIGKSSQKPSQYFTSCKGHSVKALFNTYFSSMCTGCLGSSPVNTADLKCVHYGEIKV